MKTRMVITKSFQKEMLECFGCEPVFGEEKGKPGVIYVFCMDEGSQAEKAFCGKLANVMKRAILSSNSILRDSEKLTNIIDKLIFKGRTEKVENGILDFFNESDNINLDGYVYFALNEYIERINTVLYRVVKNNLRKESLK